MRNELADAIYEIVSPWRADGLYPHRYQYGGVRGVDIYCKINDDEFFIAELAIREVDSQCFLVISGDRAEARAIFNLANPDTFKNVHGWCMALAFEAEFAYADED